jgi:hypothetical protein
LYFNKQHRHLRSGTLYFAQTKQYYNTQEIIPSIELTSLSLQKRSAVFALRRKNIFMLFKIIHTSEGLIFSSVILSTAIQITPQTGSSETQGNKQNET